MKVRQNATETRISESCLFELVHLHEPPEQTNSFLNESDVPVLNLTEGMF